MSISKSSIQLAAKIGTEGSYDPTVEAGAHANVLLYDPTLNYDVAQYERDPVRPQMGKLASLSGSRLAVIKMMTELKGSGTAGTAPAWGKLLKGCGFGETIESGVASNTVPAKHPQHRNSTVEITPTLTGTFSGTKNGIFFLTLESLVADTSATFRWQFFPDDGTAGSTGTVAMTTTGPTAMTLGLSLSLALDPNSSTTGFVLGDQWTFRATSSTSVRVSYKTNVAQSLIPCLNVAYYEDGRIFKVHSVRGNMELAAQIGQPVMMTFEFRGVPEEEVDGALLSGISFDDVVPPVFQGVIADLGGSSPQCFSEFTLNMGNVLSPRQCAEADSGYLAVRIPDRDITASINPEAALLADDNPFAKLFSGATDALAIQIGTVAGNIIEINARYVQTVGVDDAEREGYRVDARKLALRAPEFDAGGDYFELEIVAR
jgi:hypothetical protein